jgi:DNA-binding MarR family transcriptional regulator
MKQLADEVLLSRTGLVRLVDRVERAGLLRREPVPEDARGSYVALTREGEGVLRRMWPTYARGIREAFLARVGDERDELRAALERIAAGGGA